MFLCEVQKAIDFSLIRTKINLLFCHLQESTDYLDRGTTTNFSRKGPSTIAKIKEALNFMRNQQFEVQLQISCSLQSAVCQSAICQSVVCQSVVCQSVVLHTVVCQSVVCQSVVCQSVVCQSAVCSLSVCSLAVCSLSVWQSVSLSGSL